MNEVCKISIANDFTDAPGARYYEDGPKSGEEFYLTLLKIKFEEAILKNGILHIDLDNVWGYPSSFISGSFGRLSKEFSAEKVIKHLTFKSDDNPMLIEKIFDEIRSPDYK